MAIAIVDFDRSLVMAVKMPAHSFMRVFACLRAVSPGAVKVRRTAQIHRHGSQAVHRQRKHGQANDEPSGGPDYAIRARFFPDLRAAEPQERERSDLQQTAGRVEAVEAKLLGA